MIRKIFSLINKVASPLPFLIFGLYLIGIGFREHNKLTQLIFYALPEGVLFGCSLAGFLFFKGWRVKGLFLCTACMAGLFIAVLHVKPRGPSTPNSDITLVHWNVGRSVNRYPKLIEKIKSDQPDILILSEVRDHVPLDNWKESFEAQTVFTYHDEQLAILSTYPLAHTKSFEYIHGDGWSVDVIMNEQTLTIIVIDVISHPLIDRTEIVKGVHEYAESLPNPFLVIGDLNTPDNSSYFEPWKEANWQHGFEAAGQGLGYSWPMVWPSWCLDYIWFNANIEPLSHQYKWCLWSDHLRQVFAFNLTAPVQNAASAPATNRGPDRHPIADVAPR